MNPKIILDAFNRSQFILIFKEIGNQKDRN